MIAHASTHIGTARFLVFKIQDAILTPLIMLLLGVALLVFLWGVFQMVINADNEEARSIGKRHMIYGVIGMVVMVSAFTIISIFAATFGIQGNLNR